VATEFRGVLGTWRMKLGVTVDVGGLINRSAAWLPADDATRAHTSRRPSP
jgi:hypothetical protein